MRPEYRKWVRTLDSTVYEIELENFEVLNLFWEQKSGLRASRCVRILRRDASLIDRANLMYQYENLGERAQPMRKSENDE